MDIEERIEAHVQIAQLQHLRSFGQRAFGRRLEHIVETLHEALDLVELAVVAQVPEYVAVLVLVVVMAVVVVGDRYELSGRRAFRFVARTRDLVRVGVNVRTRGRQRALTVRCQLASVHCKSSS